MSRVNEMMRALRKCAEQHEREELYTGQIVTSSLCRDVADHLEETKWHYTAKGDYPPVGEFDATSHLVLVFWWNTDCNGKKAKVYGLDRWCEQHKEWDKYPQHPIAWQPLPEPPEVEE